MLFQLRTQAASQCKIVSRACLSLFIGHLPAKGVPEDVKGEDQPWHKLRSCWDSDDEAVCRFHLGRSLTDHSRCRTVEEKMSTLASGLRSRSVECTPNTAQIDFAPANSPRGGLSRVNTLRQGTTSTTITQVRCLRFPYIHRQRQLIPAPAFCTNGDPCILPIDVF
jgi:hypothetical protein